MSVVDLWDHVTLKKLNQKKSFWYVCVNPPFVVASALCSGQFLMLTEVVSFCFYFFSQKLKSLCADLKGKYNRMVP